MEDCGERRQEILKRLNADEDLLGGTTEANFDPAEEERQRKLKNEIEKALEINRGWFFRRFGAGGKGGLRPCCFTRNT